MIRSRLHWFLYLLLLIGSCAKQTSPTGGPKDTIPPVLVNAQPAQGTINFKGDQLRMEFSEMIMLENPREQIIVTPSIGKDFEVKVRRNSLVFEFNAPLEDSTTYTFNFREAVQDVTEKNPVRNLKLAISTGYYIDSLSISGTVYDLLTGDPAKDATVAIHVPNDTFSILKHPAVYFTRTDDKGQYIIDNLKGQVYYTYALMDKNRNLIADSRSESYGFLSDSLLLQRDTSGINIPLFRLDTRQLAITSARPYNTYFNIKTTKNLREFTITTPDSLPIYTAFGEDAANIRVYNTFPDSDSVAIRFVARDSLDNTIDSIFYAKFADRQVTPDPFTYTLSKSRLIGPKGRLEGQLVFTKPVAQINFDSLFFQVDSATLVSFAPDDLIPEPARNTIRFIKHLDRSYFSQPESVHANGPPRRESPAPATPAQLNQLILGTGAFISVEGDSSRRTTQKIQPLRANELSIISFDVRITGSPLVVQLLDKTGNILQQKVNVNKGQFEDLTASQYSLRVIIDRNGNGKWDPGNYEKHQEPEPILFYREPEKNSTLINLKANWELGPLLISS